MPKNIGTHIYCLDDHRSFTDEIRKKFDDTSRYTVDSFQAREDLLNRLRKDKESISCKIAVIGIRDPKDELQPVEKMTDTIRKLYPHMGIIILCPHEKFEEISKKPGFNFDACIPRNANFVLRVHNTVKKLFSEYNIVVHRKRRNKSLLALLAFVIFTVVLIIFARLKFPEFF